jgi:hypothetical protein
MRINRENTLIEDHSYPLAGMREEDVCRFFCDAIRPFVPHISQIQGAVLLHNIPFFCVIIVLSSVFLYSFRIVNDSGFPMFLYVLGLYPLLCLLFKLGGQSMVKSFYVKLPDLPETAPDRIRTIEEIVEMVWKPTLVIWRIGFFVYRTYVCPNVVDIIVLLSSLVLLGFVFMAVNVVAVAFVALFILLTFPALLTRKSVFDFLVRHFRSSAAEEDGGG